MATPSNDSGMGVREVFAVLGALEAAGCRFWLEGGWGVDALVGHQTRPHRDVDVDVDAECGDAALAALAQLGSSSRQTGARIVSSWPRPVAAGWTCTHCFSRRTVRLNRLLWMVAFTSFLPRSSPWVRSTGCRCHASLLRLSVFSTVGTKLGLRISTTSICLRSSSRTTAVLVHLQMLRRPITRDCLVPQVDRLAGRRWSNKGKGYRNRVAAYRSYAGRRP